MPVHLTQGSTEPPLPAGKLRLYGMRFCPFDQRVHLVMIAKNIPHDTVWINLTKKPEWYVNKIPSTKVPGLLVDGQPLYESLIIADYLDEKFPERPLHSKDPLRKAQDRILIENFGKVSFAFYKIVKDPSPVIADLEVVVTELQEFDKELASRGTKYFAGEQPGMLDYMIWPWFERMSALKLIHGEQFHLPLDKLKSLTSWIDAMKEDKVVKEYQLKPETHAEYLKGYSTGSPNFEIPV